MIDTDVSMSGTGIGGDTMAETGDTSVLSKRSIRSRGELPGIPLDDWLKERGASPFGGKQVTTAGLTASTSKELVSKSAECVRGIEALDRILGSESTMKEAASRTGLDTDTLDRTLRTKREELVRRRDAYKSAIDAPTGFTLMVDHDGESYTFG